MGWNAQPTRQVIFDDVRVPAAQPARRGGRRLRHRDERPQRRPPQHRRLLARRRARPRSTGPSPTSQERKAFGEPLIEQQALLFQLADMETELEAARTLLWRAADALDARRRRHGAAVRDGQAVRHRRRVRRRQRGAAAARRLRLPRRVRHREDRARPARAPDPGRHQRDHAAHRRPRACWQRRA